jgi:hypothetical protein
MADYTWVHEGAPGHPLTQTLHGLFQDGLATVANENHDRAVLTERGRAIAHSRRQRTASPF